MTAAFSFLVEQPQNECELSDVLDPLLAASTCFPRGRHHLNAVIHAGSTLFEGGFEVFSLLASVRSRDAFFVVLSLGTFFLAQVFLITSSSVFPIFSDKLLLLRKNAVPQEKVLRKRFSLPTNNQALWPIYPEEDVFRSPFCWPIERKSRGLTPVRIFQGTSR